MIDTLLRRVGKHNYVNTTRAVDKSLWIDVSIVLTVALSFLSPETFWLAR